MPENPKIENLSWSPDEKKLSFTHTSIAGLEFWLVDLETKNVKKIYNQSLNVCICFPFVLLKNSQELLVKKLPENRIALKNDKKNLPSSPFSNSDGKVCQNGTNKDLLKITLDEENFIA